MLTFRRYEAMSKHILLFGAGKSAFVLIRFLVDVCSQRNWQLTVADQDLEAILSKLGEVPGTHAAQIDIHEDETRARLIRAADLVISLLPPALHVLVAVDCLRAGKHLLTASYIDNAVRRLQPDIERSGLLFLYEMGLDPGIDHMSAMKLVDRIREDGGQITGFESHCGGLMAPGCDDNPWRYKISWNPQNVVNAGKAGAVFREHGQLVSVPYEQVFTKCRSLSIPGLDNLVAYPNRDCTSYIPLYGLESCDTFIRTTLRYPAFCNAWQAIVDGGLTSDQLFNSLIPATFGEWAASVKPHVSNENIAALRYLGLFSDEPVPSLLRSPATVLQYLLETRLAMNATDRDMIVMRHDVDYLRGGIAYRAQSLLVVEGTDSQATAMAKTVGLPLGIAALMILDGRSTARGLQIPVHSDIYNVVLPVLEAAGIRFMESSSPVPAS